MACFIAPAGVAVVTTVVQKIVQKKEQASAAGQVEQVVADMPGKWTQRLSWLNLMLWGGTLMLVLDHLISGELTLRPPFLTALENPAQVGIMLREIVVTGGAMTAAVVAAWALMIVVFEARAKAKAKLAQEA